MEESVTRLNRKLVERNREVYALSIENKSLKDVLLMKQFNFNTIKSNVILGQAQHLFLTE